MNKYGESGHPCLTPVDLVILHYKNCVNVTPFFTVKYVIRSSFLCPINFKNE